MNESIRHTPSDKATNSFTILRRSLYYHRNDNIEYVRCPYYGSQYCEKYNLINVTCNGWKEECNYE